MILKILFEYSNGEIVMIIAKYNLDKDKVMKVFEGSI